VRRGIDAAALVEAAAAIADAEGLSALTLNAVAARVGVKTPSLYSHVDGLPALRRLLGIEAARRLGARFTRAAVGRHGEEAVRALAAAYRSFAREHPGLYAATQVAPPAEDLDAARAAAEIVSVVVDVLAGLGLSGDAAVHGARAIRAALHGFVSLEAAGGFGLALSVDDSFALLVEALIRGLRANSR
jgi:AcrR family transcriptional regulator